MTPYALVLASLLVVPVADDAGRTPYPRGEILIEVADVPKPDAGKQVRLVDVRTRDKYDQGHIPGAIWADLARASRTNIGEPPELVGLSLLGQVQAAPDTAVIVYDDGDVRDAARAWWMLRYWGLKNVRLLHGGWPAWQASGGASSREQATVADAGLKYSQIPERLATKKFLLEALETKRFQLVDSRSEKEHCGETRTAQRNGSIPGAVQLEWTDTLDPKTRRFKSPDELNKIFKDAGIDLSKPSVTYCQSGGRAAVMAFALELMGAKEVRNYYRSWAEWGNDPATPVDKPAPKKK